MILVVFSFFSEPIPTESPFGSCPDGFQDYGHDDYCYKIQYFEYAYSDWPSANYDCLGLGGHLVSIHSDKVS